MPNSNPDSLNLTEIAQQARRAYVDRVIGAAAGPWWSAVIVTASSARQAEKYRAEIQRRRESDKLPSGALYLVVADLDDARIGSGGATLNGLRALAGSALTGEATLTLEDWWKKQRVLMIHSGGDSRRLPEYSLTGKLFSALPVKTPWGDMSTVFDEMLALSTLWAERVSCGLVVSSGDVILTFPAELLDWDRPGVCGAAMRQPMAVGSQHGVYVIGDEGRVYSFLQKPSAAQVKAAGGFLTGDQVALDIGLLRFDAAISARLTGLAGAGVADGRWRVGMGLLGDDPSDRPVIDLYRHMTLALTGEWSPGNQDPVALQEVAKALDGVPFWCSLVEGDFTHVGTTSHFRRLMTEESSFSRLYTAQQRLGTVNPPDVESAGVIADSVLAGGGELAPGSIVIECDLRTPVRAGRGAILHGLTDVPAPVDVPEECVVHQAPVRLEDGRRGVVIRAYGVRDDPKLAVAGGAATWFDRPILSVLEELGLDPEQVWPGVPAGERCLWNARLYVFGAVEEAWNCACWLMGLGGNYGRRQWRDAEKLSLADSALWADTRELTDARSKRLHTSWRMTALALADSGTDIRPLLAYAPGVAALSETGRALESQGQEIASGKPTEAASRHFMASLFLGQAGLEKEAEEARAAAFRSVREAVDQGGKADAVLQIDAWRHDSVRVAGPARIDFGGGWSDTPPFCLDWGGTVLNMAITLDGLYPIITTIRRLEEPLVRCVSAESGETTEYRSVEEITAPLLPGSSLAIPRAALQLAGVVQPGISLLGRLEDLGGGLEIRTEVHLPMGSGLGTSSILAATLLRAIAELGGIELSDHHLSDLVMRLEQLLTTGGGWQDQAGGIYPGAKLVMTGPGLRQAPRMQPVPWSAERQREFMERFLVYYTGIRRIAKNLLAEVVGRYLARETATVQVLHSIKTLAVEMSYAMSEGNWDYLGNLLDRHWQLNQILDPHTTNAPIDGLLHEIRPHLAGAKLAGAGGGGFLMLLTKGPEHARKLRRTLAKPSPFLPGKIHEFQISAQGLRADRE